MSTSRMEYDNVPEQQAAYDEGKRAGRAGKGLYYSGPHTPHFLDGVKAGRAERGAEMSRSKQATAQETTMSDKPKWTPEPWHVNAIKDNRIVGDETAPAFDKLQICNHNATVATVYRRDDARVIKAAPLMVEALRDVEDSKMSNGELGGGYYTLSGDTIRKIRAALRAAGVEP